MFEDAIEKISKQAQDYYKNSPVIILGSGASAAFGMSGMWKLAEHLMTYVEVSDLTDNEQISWASFCTELKKGADLETALHDIPLSQDLTLRVVKET